jgi:ubiquinone/menaquinone biosynthesis C-methylase UbiE
MSTEKRDFNSEAASWDENPGRVKLANDVADIMKEVALTPEMDVLDFGCGTGLLSFRLQPFVRSITGVDSSQGMLDVMRVKISRQNISNVQARQIDIERGDILTGRYHLIVSSMTFHHIREIMPLLDQLYAVTAASGYLCIIDLDLEGGKFHDSNEGVFHFGFDKDHLSSAFREAGFDDVHAVTASEIVKPAPDGEIKSFTVFLMIGRKR